MTINNLYAFLSVLTVAMLLFISFVIMIIKKINLNVSKKGLILNTKNGLFVSKDILEEYRDFVEAESRIKFIEIVQNQMINLERGTVVFYSELTNIINQNIDFNNIKLRATYKVVFELHRLRMLNIFKSDIIYKNHFLQIEDWEGYKRKMFDYTHQISLGFLNDIFVDFHLEEREKIKDETNEQVKQLYGKFFFLWMDELKQITKEKTSQLNKIKTLRKNLTNRAIK